MRHGVFDRKGRIAFGPFVTKRLADDNLMNRDFRAGYFVAQAFTIECKKCGRWFTLPKRPGKCPRCRSHNIEDRGK